MLQRLAEIAERVHPPVHGIASKHLDAQFQSAVMKVLHVHRPSPTRLVSWQQSIVCCEQPD